MSREIMRQEDAGAEVREAIDSLYRTESRRILATLIRLLHDFDLAEEALQDAFASALQSWPKEGIPGNPRAWLVSAGRFRAIDAIRRRVRFDASLARIAEQIDAETPDFTDIDEQAIEDDRLRLIFTCCHPALKPENRVALTLREVCGLTTEEIARAFLTPAPTLAQRIVRAKGKIRDAGIPYEVPEEKDLPDRLDAVLQVVYLVFNEGYSASFGDAVTRPDVSAEALRLGRLVLQLLPDSEVMGLMALMLLQDARRSARSSADGDLILLEDQDRSLWNRVQIEEGQALVNEALKVDEVGSYTLQAAIAGVHAGAASAAETDWGTIARLYGLLLRATESPVVELNLAVAIAMRDGPEAGIERIDAILERGELADYHLAHSARADLLRRAGRASEAAQAYRKALTLVRQEPERRFLMRRLQEIASSET